MKFSNIESLHKYGGVEYRLGDFAFGYLQRIAPTINTTLFFCNRWPTSIGCELATIFDGNYSPNIHEFTAHMDRLVWARMNNSECRASNKWDVVIHIRLGDVFDWTQRYDCHKKTSQGKSCYYAPSPVRLGQIVKQANKITRSVAIVGNPKYRSGSLNHNGSVSMNYVTSVCRILNTFTNTTLRLNYSTDCDIITLLSSRVLIISRHGGFARLVRLLAERRGHRVIIM